MEGKIHQIASLGCCREFDTPVAGRLKYPPVIALLRRASLPASAHSPLRARRRAGLIVFAALASAGPALAAVPRQVPTVAEILSVKGDEQVRFVEDPRLRPADVQQALATGDALRTGPYGGVAILFRDQTPIRLPPHNAPAPQS